MTTNASRKPRGPGRRALTHVLLLVGVVATMTFLPQCGGQHALLLSIRSEKKVGTIEFKVKRLSDNKVIFERAAEKVDPSNPNRDISDPKQALKVALEFEEAGNYLVYILGRSGAELTDRYYFLQDFQVEGVGEETVVVLKAVVADADGDGFPACGGQGVENPKYRFLDCNDQNPQVNPFAKEVCGNDLDDDCSAFCEGKGGKPGDERCEDADGDGEPSTTDCDDHDPCRSTKYKEAANLCGLPPASDPGWGLKGCTKASPAPHCGDGVDNDCNGQDVACVIDEDCDGFPAASDCDDKDPKVNPGAAEECDGKDNNCNKIVDEGCVPCDVDGDAHANPLSTDPACDKPKDDPDDFDAGIHPGTTAGDSGGKEGGTVLGALREVCSIDVNKDKNKLRPRDVDHDGDKLAAKDDGCPPESCDADGDGFSGPGCSPPKALEDCNDGDAKIFPGAPDKCGDGIAQGCGTDASCSCDKDGDGYCPPLDCDDTNKEIHPWAVEKCDGVDNDCDKLVDEANPDGTGALIATNKASCSDDNDGRCGFDVSVNPADPGKWVKGPSGFCACSKLKPTATRDGSNRMVCPGEDLQIGVSQRCFGATQPTLEHCDTQNWDCNDHTITPSEPFVDAGKTCGTSDGNCKAGKVIGCDLAKTEPLLVKQVLGAKNPPVEYNEHWVCSDTWLPAPEVCNGKDDDCDKSIPAAEIDSDGDKFLGCSGCPPKGPGRFEIDPSSPLLGCGDCNPTANKIFPGAPEECNNTDDNCDGKKDETPNVCSTSGGKVCCFPHGCRDLTSDFDHCSGCNQGCDSKVASVCTNSKCVCGTSASSCGPGLNCVGTGPAAQCKCIVNGRCGGCCDGEWTCLTLGSAQSPTKCGAGGATCKTCVDGNDCTEDLCQASGACTNPTKPAKTACESGSGKCAGAVCCKGCISGTSCQPGTIATACGAAGIDCVNCAGGNQCQDPSCNAGTCEVVNKPGNPVCNDGQFCTVNDVCTAGTCGGAARDCTTGVADQCNTGSCNDTTNQCVKVPIPGSPSCDDGLFCSNPDTCNASGACTGPARDCSGVADECNTGSCSESTDQCVKSPRTNWTTNCAGGKCYNGSCCTTCRTATGTCAGDGTSDLTCGTGGENCEVCTGLLTCVSGNCSCTGGCVQSGTCYPGDTTAHCGPEGGTCVTCPAPPACQTATCTAAGACSTENVPDGAHTSCVGGTCKGGVCCTGCWNGTTCEPGTAKALCGKGGITCVICTGSEVCQTSGPPWCV